MTTQADSLYGGQRLMLLWQQKEIVWSWVVVDFTMTTQAKCMVMGGG